MRVHRAMPDDGWTPVSNAAARDHRLSWRARGLLAELLSYPDGWDITIDKLVAQAREQGDATEGRAAMRNAVGELAALGYVRYIREPGERGHWTTVMSVCDVPQPEPDARRTRNRTVGAPDHRSTGPSVDRTVGQPGGRGTETSGGRSIKQKTDTKTVTKTEDQTPGTDQNSTASGRFAPSGGGDTNSIFNDDPWAMTFDDPPPPKTSPAAELTRKREDDRQMFRDLIEATHLRSDGSNFGKGVWTVDEFYDAFRRFKVGGQKNIGFPGAYIQPMYATNPASGVRDWLLSNGLEPL